MPKGSHPPLVSEKDTKRGKAGVSRQDRDRSGAEAIGDPPLNLGPVNIHLGEEAIRGRV